MSAATYTVTLSRWQVRAIVLRAGLSTLHEFPVHQWPAALVAIARMAWRAEL